MSATAAPSANPPAPASAGEPPLVLSIQSHVAFGHVGNDAAMLPLQLLGIQPVAVHTVQFSNHTGYGEFKGQVFPPAHIGDVLDGLRARGVLARCTAVLSGYLGDAGVGEAILAAVQEIRAVRPGLRYLCDPVMGDVGRGVFVRPGIPEFLRRRSWRRPASSPPTSTNSSCCTARRWPRWTRRWPPRARCWATPPEQALRSSW